MRSAFGVEHTVAKREQAYHLRITPTTKGERRKERAKSTASGAATAGGLSAGLTAALNPKGGRAKPALQMLGIGGGIGGALGAAKKPARRRTQLVPANVEKAIKPWKPPSGARAAGRKAKRGASNAYHNVTSTRARRRGNPDPTSGLGAKMGRRKTRGYADNTVHFESPKLGISGPTELSADTQRSVSRANAVTAGLLGGFGGGAVASAADPSVRRSKKKFQANVKATRSARGKYGAARRKQKQEVGKARGYQLITDVGTAAGRRSKKNPPRYRFDRKTLGVVGGGGLAATYGLDRGVGNPQRKKQIKRMQGEQRSYAKRTAALQEKRA